jgi:hypothetical protein
MNKLIQSSLIASVLVLGNAANAVSFSFGNITPGDTVGDSYADFFTMEVTESLLDTDITQFSFINLDNGTLGGDSAIKQVAFSTSNSSLLENMNLNVGNSGDVDFKSSTQNLSQSNNIDGWVTENFGAKTDGGNANAVQTGEILGITFGPTVVFGDILNALNDGSLIVGIHVGSLDADASDTYYNNPPTAPVPEPSTVAMFGAAFLMLGFVGYRNRKS